MATVLAVGGKQVADTGYRPDFGTVKDQYLLKGTKAFVDGTLTNEQVFELYGFYPDGDPNFNKKQLTKAGRWTASSLVGLVTGGPAGMAVAIAGNVAKDKADKAKATIFDQYVEAGEYAKAQKEAEKALSLQASANGLLAFDGPKLWALSILIVFVIVLFYSKKSDK